MDFAQELTYLATTIVALFVIIDPFAVVPVYLSLTEKSSIAERRSTRRKATLIAMGILLTFASFGMGIFHIFGITLPAFQIAGGILLLILGLEQLHGKRQRVAAEEHKEGMEKDDISIFPLATPLLAGPGAISTVVLYSSKVDSVARMMLLAVAVIIALLASHFLIVIAPALTKVLGKTGLNLLTRLMGIILTAIAVQFFLNGIKGALQAMGVLQ